MAMAMAMAMATTMTAAAAAAAAAIIARRCSNIDNRRDTATVAVMMLW